MIPGVSFPRYLGKPVVSFSCPPPAHARLPHCVFLPWDGMAFLLESRVWCLLPCGGYWFWSTHLEGRPPSSQATRVCTSVWVGRFWITSSTQLQFICLSRCVAYIRARPVSSSSFFLLFSSFIHRHRHTLRDGNGETSEPYKFFFFLSMRNTPGRASRPRRKYAFTPVMNLSFQ